MTEWTEDTRSRLKTARLANTNPVAPLGVFQTDIAVALAELDRRAERIAELEERERDLLAELDSYRSDLINESVK